MGRLGYQSDAQASLAVSYNSLDDYASALQDALTQPYPAYVRLLVCVHRMVPIANCPPSLLQIENEFYGTIRPKRVLQPNERPLHALRERGVEYVEVRLMDLDPFEPVGISSQTMRFLDVFLLHCLLSDSPPHAGGKRRTGTQPAPHGGTWTRARPATGRRHRPGTPSHSRTGDLRWWSNSCRLPTSSMPWLPTQATAWPCNRHNARCKTPKCLPSARVLDTIRANFNNSFADFAIAQSLATKQVTLEKPLSPDVQAHFQALAQASLEQQRRIEANVANV